MIEILLKNREIISVNSTDEIAAAQMDFYAIQFIDYTEEQISWAAKNFGIDCALMRRYEDIEISSHFLAKNNQTAFHISIPYYDDKDGRRLTEAPVFFVMSNNGLFFFSNSAINQFFDDKYAFKFSEQILVSDIREILMYQLGFISDYYADIAENEAKQIKKLAASVTLTNNFSEDVTDLITLLTFNNLRLKESLIATIRVFSVFKKHSTEEGIGTKERIDAELNDLAVVSDYIQFNFERLDNLSNHVTNKINLEQNQIVKILTVVTLCISLPTFITGIYGMNFKHIPELTLPHGYPIIIGVMIVSAILPYLFFKRKKWL